MTDVRVVRDHERAGGEPLPLNPGIENVIEAIGLGLGQLVIISVAMGTFCLDGLMATLMNTTSSSAALELGFPGIGWGQEMACFYVGRLLGTIATGLTVDSLGLSTLIMSGLGVLSLFIMLISFSNTEDWFLQTRFMVGLGAGLCQGPALALVYELVPQRWKTFMISLTFSSASLGAMLGYAIFVSSDSQQVSTTNTLPLPDDHWRMEIRLATIPSALLFLFSFAYIPDSPSWLATHGDVGLARDLLKRIRNMNEMEYVSVLFRKLHIPNGVEQTKIIIMSFPMLGLCFASFSMSFTMTGMQWTFPLPLHRVLVLSGSEFSAPIVQVFGLVALTFALLLGTTCYAPPNPKVGLLWSVTIGSIALALFYFLSAFPSAAIGAFALPMLAVIGLVAAPCLALIFVYKITADMCPMNCTAIGLSVVLSAGNVGKLAFPVLNEVAPALSRYQVYAISTVACLCVLILVGPAQFVPWDVPVKTMKQEVQHDGDEFIFAPSSQFDGHKGTHNIDSQVEDVVP